MSSRGRCAALLIHLNAREFSLPRASAEWTVRNAAGDRIRPKPVSDGREMIVSKRTFVRMIWFPSRGLPSAKEGNVGGLVIDVFVAYLYKSSIHIFEFVESIRWNRATASIVESSVRDPGIGCPSVIIRYQIDEEPNPQVTEQEIPFLSTWDANPFAKKFSANRRVLIRIHPESSTRRHFYAFDQK
jgi:hypothetical protein